MSFLKYSQKFLGSYGKKVKCEYCNANLENESVEMLEHVHYTGGSYSPVYFCFGHLEKWAKDQRREYMLNKL
jgi:hypothetical protein